LHTLNLGCSIITLREQCNNQRPRCDIVWLDVTNHLFHDFPSISNPGNRGINITNTFNHSGRNVLFTVSDLQSNLEYIKTKQQHNETKQYEIMRGH